MRTLVNRVPVAVAMGVTGGIVVGVVAATAMASGIGAAHAAVCVVGAWVHQTYIKPKGAHAEQSDAEAAQ